MGVHHIEIDFYFLPNINVMIIFRTMSGVKLTIILPTKHRISVKVSSKEALIRQVLEDACVKKSLDPDAHQLRRNNKVMQCANNILGILDYNKLPHKV